jgi:hypothetical protein
MNVYATVYRVPARLYDPGIRHYNSQLRRAWRSKYTPHIGKKQQAKLSLSQIPTNNQ